MIRGMKSWWFIKNNMSLRGAFLHYATKQSPKSAEIASSLAIARSSQ